MRWTLPLLAGLILAGGVLAQEEAFLADYVPEGVPVYIEARNPPLEELQGMAMARMFQDPRMKALLDRAAEEDAASSVSNMRMGLGERRGLRVRTDVFSAPSVAVDVMYVDEKGEKHFQIRNRFALAWVGVQQGGVPLDLVAALEVDTGPAEALRIIERIVAAASLQATAEGGGEVDAEVARLFEHSSYRDAAISSAQLGSVSLHLAPVGRLLVVATSKARIHDVLDRHAESRADSLAAGARYRRMLEEAPGTGTATTRILVNVDRVMQQVVALAPQRGAQIQAWLQYAGLGGLESVTTVARVDGEGVTATTSFAFAGPERRGLARLFEPGRAARYGCLEFAPKDCLYVYCGSLDTKGLRRMALELGGMAVAMAESRFESTFGLHLEKDVLNLLGPEAALVVAPNRGLVPDIALVFESPDAERLARNLRTMLDAVPWPEGTGPSTFRIRDVEVHSVPLLHPALGSAPMAPTFGVVDGRLLVAAYPLGFQRILAVKRGGEPGLAANREFARLRERVPNGALGLSYLDMRRLFEVIYETGIPFLQSFPNAGGPTNLYEFPEVDVFSKYLFGRIAWRTADERGLKWQSYSALDTSGFLVSALVGGALAVHYTVEAEQPEGAADAAEAEIPRVEKRTGRDLEARMCRHRTRILKSRLLVYRQEHGRLPGAISELEAEWVPAETFVVPGTDRSYVYLGPAGKGDILLHGFPNGEDQRICVVTVDLKIERLSAAELERRLRGD